MTTNAEMIVKCCGALAATPGRLLRPRKPDRRFLESLDNAALPRARATVKLTSLVQSSKNNPAAFIAEGARKPRQVRSGMTTFLVEHPSARFVVDPAMCADVHHRVLPEISPLIRPIVSPAKPVIGLAEILSQHGIDVGGIDFALPTHLHWDHVSGLLDLPDRLPVRALATERSWAMDGSAAPSGIARGPLSTRTFEAYELDGPPVLTFERSHDVFGDGSVLLVDLAGHTPGSVGVLVALDDGRRVLLAGDAVWHGLQVQLLREKAPFPGQIVDADRLDAFRVVHRLHALPAEIEVVASHDYGAAAKFAPVMAR
ncbi:MBL fold metallo-hydrolase [Antrihabitans cavernicola]|uniref:MBL fold metallo-hydrolase n=1 Tax=Antrihabitans cavernicola TaxID=2495913 RepID=A0A5A7S317_9NOCA|nr:MBL fold metallo-hydrolase [Spelaeibacter cavernicola]KAA0018906.1 MBL fold metallo-hydrolase [Spelaeibacter cavernicola]